MLIDGDGAKFADAFLQNPMEGAPRAAQALKQAVRNYIQNEFPELDSDDIPILIRVYANLNGLAQSLRLSRVINRDDDMKIFAEQFTNSRTEVDFVNVGRLAEIRLMGLSLTNFARTTEEKRMPTPRSEVGPSINLYLLRRQLSLF